jgi:hypothetical protein
MTPRQGGMSGGQKTLKAKIKLKMNYQARVHSGQLVLLVVREGGWTKLTVAKAAERKVGK